MEALLLLWNSRPKASSVEGVAKGLFMAGGDAHKILDDLARQGLIVAAQGDDETYYYEPQPDRDHIIGSLHSKYREDLIWVSMLIHSKPSAAAREIANRKKVND
jgi:hypothetical protein